MALVLKDRVKETTTTTGTGTVTLAGAAAGFQSFAAVGDGNQTFYAIVDATSGDWEVGVGAYTASGTTLSRATVVSSSNAGSLVNFGAGSKDVFVTYPSSRAVYLDAAGSAVSVLDIGTLGVGTANVTTANITSGTVSTAPASGNDLVNKSYVDTLVASGIHFHQPVRVESPINLNATYNNGTAGVGATLTNAGTQAALVIDGVTVSVADRVLVYEQTNQTQNGVYVVTDVGSGSTNWVLTRATDADTFGFAGPDTLSEGSTFFVQQGATGAGETYTCNTTGVITFGTTNITFAQISSAQIYSAGTGLTLSGTQFSITNTGTAGTYGSASSVPVITTNAQGQVTGVTPTAIAISGAAVSGNISGQAGSVANALTAGTFLTAAGTFDGSAARTFAVDATDANTASKVVARDASGNFSAGTITATLSGAATSATTATNLAGGAANRIAYQTSAGISNFIAAPTASNQVLNWNGSAFTWSAGTISGVALGSNLNTLTFGTYLTGTSYNGSGAVTLATNATNANTASTIVARDASGNFSAGTITAALSGNATTATSATSATSAGNLTGGTISGNYVVNNATSPNSFYLQFGDNTGWTYRFMTSVAGTPTTRFSFGDNGNFTAVGTVAGTNITTGGNTTGNAATATALQTARTINGTSFNGTANITITAAANGGNSATVGGLTPSATAAVANRVVAADGNGYIFNNYFNSTDNSVASGVTAVMVKAGDSYLRSGTAAAIATFISGQSMNISGTATNQSGGTVSATTGSFNSTVTLGATLRRSAAAQGWLDGNYSSSETANTSGAIYSIGTAYPPGTTSLGTMYGVGFTVGNGTANPGLGMTGWGFYAASSGVSRVFLDSDNGIVISSGSTRSPIFYDRDNTGYYLDPTSSQSLRTVGDWRSDAAAWTGEFSGKIQYHSSIWYLQAATGHQFRNSGGSQTMFVDSAGNLTATANITAYSDARLKENVVTVDNALDKATALRGVYYNKIGESKRRVGVIAQEIQEVLPEVVLSITEKNPATGEESEMLAVDYGNIVGLLIEAVKELRAEVEKLKGGQ